MRKLSVQEFAKESGVTEKSVYRWIKSGQYQTEQVGPRKLLVLVPDGGDALRVDAPVSLDKPVIPVALTEEQQLLLEIRILKLKREKAELEGVALSKEELESIIQAREELDANRKKLDADREIQENLAFQRKVELDNKDAALAALARSRNHVGLAAKWVYDCLAVLTTSPGWKNNEIVLPDMPVGISDSEVLSWADYPDEDTTVVTVNTQEDYADEPVAKKSRKGAKK